MNGEWSPKQKALNRRRLAYLRLIRTLVPKVPGSDADVENWLSTASTPEEIAIAGAAFAKRKLEVNIARSIRTGNVGVAARRLDKVYGVLLGSKACDKETLDTVEKDTA